MKKIYYILTLVAAAMTISACNNAFEDEGPALNGGEGSENTITFVVGPETDAEGRTALDLEDGATTLWNGTETAGLYYNYRATGAGSDTKVANAQNIVYTATLGSDSATATFTGEAEWVDVDASAHKFYFYYPYNEDTESHTKVHGILPAEQTYDATASKWDMSAYDFVYANNSKAMPESAVELKIKRAFAVLRLGITNATGEDVTIEEVSLTSEGGKVLAGEFIANTSKGEVEQGLTSHTVANGTNYGYWKSTKSTITTTVSNGAVAATKKIDVRFMLNAGYAPKAESPYYDETTSYLEGDTFTVRIKTNKGTHPAVQFTAGALLRGARAGKSITLEAIPAGEPNATSVVSNDSSEDKFYLNNTITITGTNLLNAQAVKVGGVAAEVVSQTGTELVVKVPDCTGTATTAADYDITYTYEDEEGTLGTISIYPFYHYENITLGMGSNSAATYSDFSSDNAYFVPDDGRVYSAKDFAATNEDYGIGLGTGVVNPYVTAKKTYDAAMTPALYAAVKPYIAFVTDSSGKLSMVNPTNTDMILKNHRYKGEGASSYNTYVGQTWGTPFMQYRVMKSSTELEHAKAVKDGSLTGMLYSGTTPTTDAPALAAPDKTSNSIWTEDSVIVVQYKDYSDKTTKINEGYIWIKNIDVTLGGLGKDSNGNEIYQLITVNPDTEKRDGKITFDMYWSKRLN
ncbi:MAG: hypothetical protein IJD12_02150 [Tidjanibacter sp.]|nr:hypothetical protein [Tidjanibacter sp.]